MGIFFIFLSLLFGCLFVPRRRAFGIEAGSFTKYLCPFTLSTFFQNVPQKCGSSYIYNGQPFAKNSKTSYSNSIIIHTKTNNAPPPVQSLSQQENERTQRLSETQKETSRLVLYPCAHYAPALRKIVEKLLHRINLTHPELPDGTSRKIIFELGSSQGIELATKNQDFGHNY